MKNDVVVEVKARDAGGSNASRRLRRQGEVPAVVYGMGLDPFLVSVSDRSLEGVLHSEAGRNSIFTLSLAGADSRNQRAVMIKDLQRDPVTEKLVHVDFLRVDLDKKVQVNVPIRIVGTAYGVKNEGGLLDFIQRHVGVECLPGNIPEHIDLDVTEIRLNRQAHVSDLVVDESVTILDDPGATLVSVVAPRAAAVAEEGVTEEAAEVAGEEAATESKGRESDESNE